MRESQRVLRERQERGFRGRGRVSRKRERERRVRIFIWKGCACHVPEELYLENVTVIGRREM